MYKDGFNMFSFLSFCPPNPLTICNYSVFLIYWGISRVEIESDDEIELHRPYEIKCVQGMGKGVGERTSTKYEIRILE